MTAPLHVPVELRRPDDRGEGERWFRLAVAVAADGLTLRSPLPEELRDGPIALRLHLPLDLSPPPPPLALVGRAAELVVDEGLESERAEPRRVEFVGLKEADNAWLMRYLQHRTTEEPAAG